MMGDSSTASEDGPRWEHDRGVVGDAADPTEESLTAAARAIFAADFLLIAAGAGFSADSGLPVYADVAANPVYLDQGIEYDDMCRMSFMKKNPEMFFGTSRYQP